MLRRRLSLLVVQCVFLLTPPLTIAAEMLTFVGSDTMSRLITAWGEEFREQHPEIVVDIQVTGSAAAPPALAERVANFGVMSRQFGEAELVEFMGRRGFVPLGLIVARDSLEVIVNQKNPAASLSLEQLDRIFSQGRLCSGLPSLTHWYQISHGKADIDREHPISERPIAAMGRTAVSGSYGFFKNRVLCGGDFHGRVAELPGFAAIVRAVSQDSSAIGYVGSGFIDSSVKRVSIETWDDGPGAEPVSPSAVLSSPLKRDLYLYLAVAPEQTATAAECAFLQFVSSIAGQEILIQQGFAPGDLEVSGIIKNVCS